MTFSDFIETLKNSIDLTSILYLYLAIVFCLMVTIFHYKHFQKKNGDYKAVLYYFFLFFLLFFLVPTIIIFFFHQDPIRFLNSIGLQFGNINAGIVLIIIFIPIALYSTFVSSRDKSIIKHYPFSKEACRDDRKFIFYEFSYLIFYYFSWEFLFRGILFFPILSSTNLVIAVSVQTIISTLLHIGHPPIEILGALIGGILFGFIAYYTESFFYVFIIHAMIGIFLDIALYTKYHRKREVKS